MLENKLGNLLNRKKCLLAFFSSVSKVCLRHFMFFTVKYMNMLLGMLILDLNT
jgi:hypothetical protein